MGARRKPVAAGRGLGTSWAPPLAQRLRSAARHHRSCLIDGLLRMSARPVATLLTIGVIGIALALPAGLLTALNNLRSIDQGWEKLGDVALFLRPGVSTEAALELGESLILREEWASFSIVTPEQARRDLEDIAGFGDALDALSENPLPHVLVMRPAAEHLEAATLSDRAAALEELEPVDYAQVDRDWLTRFNGLLDLAERSTQLLSALLALAVLLIVGNTIRLDVESRHQEIEVTRLLGATDGFVRRPLLYAGFWYGVLGGLLAVLLIALAALLLAGPVADLADAYNSDFRLTALGLRDSVQWMAAGAIIGLAGAWVAVGRQLAGVQPE